MPVITCIDDLKRIYRRRVPRMFYDYAESGSWTEQTFRENSSDFADIRLRQRIAVDMTGRTVATQMIGQDVAMPVALAPVGLTGMQNADGEIKAARAAEKFGVPFTLSTMSICSIEDVARHTSSPFWFQIYTLNDDAFNASIINRAKAAGCSALVITVDLQILGQRHKDLKNGLSAPPKLTIPTMLNLATKWAWGLEMLGTKRRFFGNIVGHVEGVDDPASLSSWTAQKFDQALDWGEEQEAGVYGYTTTGIFSFSDLVANFNGWRFWNRILLREDDPLKGFMANLFNRPYVSCEIQLVATIMQRKIVWAWEVDSRFDLSDYLDGTWDEGNNCNSYKDPLIEHKVAARIKRVRPGFSCPFIPDHCVDARRKYGRYAKRLLHPYCLIAGDR